LFSIPLGWFFFCCLMMHWASLAARKIRNKKKELCIYMSSIWHLASATGFSCQIQMIWTSDRDITPILKGLCLSISSRKSVLGRLLLKKIGWDVLTSNNQWKKYVFIDIFGRLGPTFHTLYWPTCRSSEKDRIDLV
jgi:hypothetical protein